MNTVKFKTREQAKRYQNSFKENYGFRPSIFEVHNRNNVGYELISSKGMKKIK